MRKGFTTGSCAAAAAKAAVWMLLTGQEKKNIEITTPAGVKYMPELVDLRRSPDQVSCGVVKDGGDDPDVTTGLHITATVRRITEDEIRCGAVKERIRILGGEGVGRVTEPGLDQPVGEAAINHVPREMILREMNEVIMLLDDPGHFAVTISVPGGKEVAEKTFNPRLGIVGGISIIGTSGIVEPMSEKALTDTIRLELRQRKLQGQRIAVVTPGNYGMDMLKKAYDYDLNRAVKCSNFIGDTIDMAVEEGYGEMVLMGHMGKLVKCAGGAMNTHSRYGDRRMELLAAAAEKICPDPEVIRRILESVSTEAALKCVSAEDAGRISAIILEQALEHLNHKAAGRLRLEMILYTNELGILAESSDAVRLLSESRE